VSAAVTAAPGYRCEDIRGLSSVDSKVVTRHPASLPLPLLAIELRAHDGTIIVYLVYSVNSIEWSRSATGDPARGNEIGRGLRNVCGQLMCATHSPPSVLTRGKPRPARASLVQASAVPPQSRAIAPAA
jgi:hypothetical protein